MVEAVAALNAGFVAWVMGREGIPSKLAAPLAAVARHLATMLREPGGAVLLSDDYTQVVTALDPERYVVTEMQEADAGGRPVYRLDAVRDPDSGEWVKAAAPELAPEPAEELTPGRGR